MIGVMIIGWTAILVFVIWVVGRLAESIKDNVAIAIGKKAREVASAVYYERDNHPKTEYCHHCQKLDFRQHGRNQLDAL